MNESELVKAVLEWHNSEKKSRFPEMNKVGLYIDVKIEPETRDEAVITIKLLRIPKLEEIIIGSDGLFCLS